jgi:hypothetical protein
MVLSTSTTHVGVPIQQTQTKLSLVTNLIPINQHLDWPQLVTPLIVRQTKIVLYPMWYNTIPSFVPMDPNMYSMYYLGIKGLDPLISGRKKGYATNVIEPKLMPPIEQLVQNQYLVRIPTFGLKELVPITRGVLVQQTMATVLLLDVIVITGLHVYGNGVPL